MLRNLLCAILALFLVSAVQDTSSLTLSRRLLYAVSTLSIRCSIPIALCIGKSVCTNSVILERIQSIQIIANLSAHTTTDSTGAVPTVSIPPPLHHLPPPPTMTIPTVTARQMMTAIVSMSRTMETVTVMNRTTMTMTAMMMTVTV